MSTTGFSTKVVSIGRPIHFFLAAAATVALFLAPVAASAQVVVLGTAQNFGVLAGSTVTNIGATVVTGDVGVAPGIAITGFPPGTTPTGALHINDGAANTAQGNLTTAYNAAAGTACTVDLTGIDLGGLTLSPGVYCFTSSAQLTGNLILNFQNDPNAAFLFKIGTTLTTASNSNILSINSGNAPCTPNVNFQVGSSATLGTGTNFAGNILALSSITLTTGATLRGRALARNGAVTLDTNLSVGGCPFAVTPAGLGGPGVGGGGGGGGGGAVTAIPTLQEWNLIFLALLLAAAGGWYARRRTIRR